VPEPIAPYATPLSGVYFYAGQAVSIKTRATGSWIGGLKEFHVSYENQFGRRDIFIWKANA